MGDQESTLLPVGAIVAGGTAALIALFDPSLAVIGAVGTPVVAGPIDRVIARFRERRNSRAEVLLEWVSRFSGVDLEELFDRCDADPRLETLLLRTLRAAGDTPVRGKIIAYASALASGVAGVALDRDANWEQTFVRTLEDLERDDLILLERFSLTAYELGLNTDPDPNAPPIKSLNQHQIEIVAQDIEFKSVSLATLQRNGLVASRSVSATGYAGGATWEFWDLTDHGERFLARLKEIGNLIRDATTQ